LEISGKGSTAAEFGLKEHRGAFRKHHGLCSVTRNKVAALGSSSADLRKRIAEIAEAETPAKI
jgi:hypothetical protein